MLKIVKSVNELNIEQFFAVYRDSIRNIGHDFYCNFHENQQVKLAEEDLLAYLRDDFFRHMDAFIAIWVVDGVYKSVLRIEPYRHGVLLHALETAPDARKMGYAFSLVSAVLEYLKQAECVAVFSHVNKRNHPSLHLHKKCGVRKSTDFAVLLDGTVTQNTCTMTLKF